MIRKVLYEICLDEGVKGDRKKKRCGFNGV